MDKLREEKVIVKKGNEKTEFRSNNYVILAVGEKGLVNVVRCVGVGGVEECVFTPATLVAMMRLAADKIEEIARETIRNAGIPVNLDAILESAKEHLVAMEETENA